ncbi:16S rRNA (uracil(1498)-N(3))-methyltransferase [Flaviflagellibacter deserti]|uniref:Ribosomal RNA small subunit methyltransferase E n=1 Tax=Flaviflagellibacter deserti TaxID=2267266 RepID=A0ABV9YYP4_9HYPH
MAKYDFSAPRLHVDLPLGAGAEVVLNDDRTNYLRNVLRLTAGQSILLFNGRDGEWRAEIVEIAKKRTTTVAREQTRAQTPLTDVWYLFAPLKHARLDYMMQKAVEMGASRLVPVITRRTQVARVNLDRMHANAVEAAEQCGILGLPEIDEPIALEKLLGNWDAQRRLVFCDEEAEEADPMAALRPAKGAPIAVVIGPEGGFDDKEREHLLRVPGVIRISLGPRVLRADTAAVAALALVQAAIEST